MKNLYSFCHLVVAAIRISEYQQSAPPSVEQVSDILMLAPEQVSFACSKLNEIGAVGILEGGFNARFTIKDHLKIEEIPKHQDTSDLQKDIQQFIDSKKEIAEKIEAIKAEKETRKKLLFAEIENKLKKGR